MGVPFEIGFRPMGVPFEAQQEIDFFVVIQRLEIGRKQFRIVLHRLSEACREHSRILPDIEAGEVEAESPDLEQEGIELVQVQRLVFLDDCPTNFFQFGDELFRGGISGVKLVHEFAMQALLDLFEALVNAGETEPAFQLANVLVVTGKNQIA